MIAALELVLVLSTLANMVVFALIRWQWGQLKRSEKFDPEPVALKALEKFRERVFQEQRKQYLESKQNITDVLEWTFANQRYTTPKPPQLVDNLLAANAYKPADDLQWSCLDCGKPTNSCKCKR